MQACSFCSGNGTTIYHSGSCPKVNMVEYYPNGQIKRIQFHDPTPDPLPYIPYVPHEPVSPWWNPPYKITGGSTSGGITIGDDDQNSTGTKIRVMGVYLA